MSRSPINPGEAEINERGGRGAGGGRARRDENKESLQRKIPKRSKQVEPKSGNPAADSIQASAVAGPASPPAGGAEERPQRRGIHQRRAPLAPRRHSQLKYEHHFLRRGMLGSEYRRIPGDPAETQAEGGGALLGRRSAAAPRRLLFARRLGCAAAPFAFERTQAMLQA